MKKIKNNQPQRKFTGSYKKKSVHTVVLLRKGANNYDKIPLTKQC